MIAKRFQNKCQNRVYPRTKLHKWKKYQINKHRISMDEIKKHRHFLVPHIVISKIRGTSNRDLQVVLMYLLRFNILGRIFLQMQKCYTAPRGRKSNGRNTFTARSVTVENLRITESAAFLDGFSKQWLSMWEY